MELSLRTEFSLAKYLVPIFLILGVSDIDYYVGYPIFDEQYLILILLTALGYANKRIEIPLVLIGIVLFFAYPYLAEYSNFEKTLVAVISIPLCILVVTSCFSSSGKAFGII